MAAEEACRDRAPLEGKTAKKLSPSVREALEIYRGRAEAEGKVPYPGITPLLIRDSENSFKDPHAPDGIDPIVPPALPMIDGLLEMPFEYDQVSWALYQKAFFQILIEACCLGGKKATRDLARVTQAVARRGSSLRIPHGKFKVYHTGLFMILEQNGVAKLTASDLAEIFDFYCPYSDCSIRGTHGAESLRRQRKQLRSAKRETIRAARAIAQHGLRKYVLAEFRRRFPQAGGRRTAKALEPAN